MPYEIIYDPRCWEDVAGAPKNLLRQIKKAIETRLSQAPESVGRPLKGKLRGQWRLRVGDYRILYRVEGESVIVLKIGHRSEVYKS